jgi:hypothetical protein
MDNEAVNTDGRRILSFQIFWTLFTLLMMLIIPSIMLFLFEPLRGGRIPLFIPVYFISCALNVYFTIRFALGLNRQSNSIKNLPNIL